MGEIDRLTPTDRIPPLRPVPGGGAGNQAPQRKPATGERDQRRQRQRKPGADDTPHVDEYA